MDDAMTIGGARITSADRVVFPGAGFTKGDIARHYATVADRFLEAAAGRPVSLVRCPSGLEKACFFQKHAMRGWPEAMQTVPIRESSGEVADYLCLSNRASVMAAVQMGTIEFHLWAARSDRLDRPDRMVFDLDPDEGLGFAEVKKAAVKVRALLDRFGLGSGAMVTGGKGIHVIVPLRRTADWETVKTFAKTLASGLADREPDRFTATMSKAKREGRIFIDWLRNDRGATAVAPYSLRARPGAPVAVPVNWNELKTLEAANAFRPADMDKRLSEPCPLSRLTPQSVGKSALDALSGWSA